jgi:hypothetical protein
VGPSKQILIYGKQLASGTISFETMLKSKRWPISEMPSLQHPPKNICLKVKMKKIFLA